MARKIIDKQATAGEPIVFAMADTYEELSDNYDALFNPDEWGASSVGIVTDNGFEVYMLDLSKNWVALSGEESAGT